MKKLFILFIAVAGFGVSSFAQVSTLPVESSATIVRPINLTKTSDLSFGKITASGAVGTVVLKADDTRQFTGGASLGTSGTFVNAPTCAKFTVSGTANATYSISAPDGFDLTNTIGTGTMAVSNLIVVTSTSGTETQIAGVISNTTGTQNLYVGATLNVGIDQNSGLYTNSSAFSITVNYN